MSDILKCPICGNDLEYYNTGLVCYRNCLNGKNVWGSEETLKELIRTRKALGVAKDKLDTVRQYHRGTAVIRPDDIAAYCDRAIDEITALEQKDK